MVERTLRPMVMYKAAEQALIAANRTPKPGLPPSLIGWRAGACKCHENAARQRHGYSGPDGAAKRTLEQRDFKDSYPNRDGRDQRLIDHDAYMR